MEKKVPQSARCTLMAFNPQDTSGPQTSLPLKFLDLHAEVTDTIVKIDLT